MEITDVLISDIHYEPGVNTKRMFQLPDTSKLRDTIIENGLQIPVEVRPLTSEMKKKTGKNYSLMSGFLRFLACRTIEGMNTVPAVIHQKGDY